MIEFDDSGFVNHNDISIKCRSAKRHQPITVKGNVTDILDCNVSDVIVNVEYGFKVATLFPYVDGACEFTVSRASYNFYFINERANKECEKITIDFSECEESEISLTDAIKKYKVD